MLAGMDKSVSWSVEACKAGWGEMLGGVGRSIRRGREKC